MNWLLILVVVFLGVYVIRGYHNGLIKTVFSIFAVLIALILAVTISPYVSKALQGNDTIFQFIDQKVSTNINKEKEEAIETEQVEQTEAINQLPLPKSIKSALIENNNPEVYKLFNVDNFQSYISNYISCIVLNAISFLLVFVLSIIIIKILANTLDLISKLPIINGINKMGGIFIGFLHGMIVLWVLCIALTAFSSTDIGVSMMEYINASRLLTMIYDNNLLLNVVTNIVKVFF